MKNTEMVRTRIREGIEQALAADPDNESLKVQLAGMPILEGMLAYLDVVTGPEKGKDFPYDPGNISIGTAALAGMLIVNTAMNIARPDSLKDVIEHIANLCGEYLTSYIAVQEGHISADDVGLSPNHIETRTDG